MQHLNKTMKILQITALTMAYRLMASVCKATLATLLLVSLLRQLTDIKVIKALRLHLRPDAPTVTVIGQGHK